MINKWAVVVAFLAALASPLWSVPLRAPKWNPADDFKLLQGKWDLSDCSPEKLTGAWGVVIKGKNLTWLRGDGLNGSTAKLSLFKGGRIDFAYGGQYVKGGMYYIGCYQIEADRLTFTMGSLGDGRAKVGVLKANQARYSFRRQGAR